MNCEHVCTSDCRREGCNCQCGEFHQEQDSVEKEIGEKAKVMPLDAHNKSVLRSMIKKENAHFDREPFVEDSNNTPVEGYYETKEY